MARVFPSAAGAHRGMAYNHILSAGQFSQEDVDTIFQVAARMERAEVMRKVEPILAGRSIATLASPGQVSLSGIAFQAATRALGGQCLTLGEGASANLPSARGNIHDTIKVLSCYAHAIVLSHPEPNAAREAASAADALHSALHRPTVIISAGDGSEDPAQALTDLYTIKERFGADIDSLTLGFLGDLKSAGAAHALIELLATVQCRANLVCIAPASLAMPPQYVEFARSREMQIEETVDLQAAIGRLDILYVTGTQRERFVARHLEDLAARVYGFPYQALDEARKSALHALAEIDAEQEYLAARDTYVIDPMMLSQARKEMILMHPLPRGKEISEAVDSDDRAYYFRQVRNGLYIRMALLACALGET